MSETATEKAARTRARILDAALSLFRERGYTGTTMRAIAEEAGVSQGNAYYYFASKEHLIHGYYARSHAAHLEAAKPLLEDERRLKDRLLAVLLSKLDVSAPDHEFAQQLFRTAADPRSPLSPFSEESKPVREQAIALMREVVEGSRERIPEELVDELPRLLWLYMMGLILFWVHDDSPGQRRTRALAERSCELVVWLIRLAGNPLLIPLRKKSLALVRMLEQPA